MDTDTSGALPNVTDLQQKLRSLLGKGLEKVTDREDFGCLRKLSLVEDRVTRNYDEVEIWREAVEEAILDGAYSLTHAQNLLTGRNKRVRVNIDRLAEAIISSFNLRHEKDLDTAKKRRAKANSALRLNCKEKTYCETEGIPCPELDLMRILAKQLLELEAVGARASTETIKLTLFMEENDGTDPVYGTLWWEYRLAVRHMDITRTLRPNSSERTWILEKGELVGPWSPNSGSAYVSRLGNSRVKMTSSSDVGVVKIIFPRTEYGQSRTLEYRRVFQPQQPLENAVLIRPSEPYDHLTLRAILPNAPQPASVWVFRDRREAPRYHYADSEMKRIKPLQDGSYCITFQQPTPNTYLGFMLLFDDYPGGSRMPSNAYQSKLKPHSTEQEKEKGDDSKPAIETSTSTTAEQPPRRRPSRRRARRDYPGN
ncbi:hypothetical protein ACWGAN_04345 [Streptomyces sp. NPDC054945]